MNFFEKVKRGLAAAPKKGFFKYVYFTIRKQLTLKLDKPKARSAPVILKKTEKKQNISKYVSDLLVSSSNRPPLGYTPFSCKQIEIPNDISVYFNPPRNLPEDIKLPKLSGFANDYSYLEGEIKEQYVDVSIIVLTYNRTEILFKTLAGIFNQNYNLEKVEVVIVDDGGTENVFDAINAFKDKLNIKYVWHKDIGFTPAAARNNGIKVAKNDFIILLDVDMYPSVDLIKEYTKYAAIVDKAVLVGPRRYVDINHLSYEQLVKEPKLVEAQSDIKTNNSVADKENNEISVDWRLSIFEETRNLKDEKVPFRVFASGNVAFSKRACTKVGGFDELFTSWGYEDVELGFRFFNDGKYVIPVINAIALHQEPKEKVNETNREEGKQESKHHFAEVCPYYRHLVSYKDNWAVPKVSIYIPAYNAETTILDAVESVLAQTFQDIEVCICDDGSTDSTVLLLEKFYSDNPKVRWVSQKNAGIGAASNTAVNLCRGIYIGQLDSDDYLAQDVVERCVNELDKDLALGLVYTSYENEDTEGNVTQGYNYPVFTHKKLITAMIVHHFRMFRKLYWCRTEGFNERIKNAVDYDIYLKIAEVCEAEHLNIVGYRRRLHGENTSLKDNTQQNLNAAVVANHALTRLETGYKCELESSSAPKLIFSKK